MAIDTTFVFSYLLYCIIALFVFFICMKIYKTTSGASLAYKKWAQGTFIMFLGCFAYFLGGILFECNNKTSTNANELCAIIGETAVAFGYFYIPVGVMHLSKDLKVGKLNEQRIKKIQIVFFSAIVSIASLFLCLFSFFEILIHIGVTFNLLHSIIWLFAIYSYNNVYSNVLKDMNTCWAYLYSGMITGLISEIFSVFMYIIPQMLYLVITFQLVMAASLIKGFYKLAKMVNAI